MVNLIKVAELLESRDLYFWWDEKSRTWHLENEIGGFVTEPACADAKEQAIDQCAMYLSELRNLAFS